MASFPTRSRRWPALAGAVCRLARSNGSTHDHEVQFCAFDILAEGDDDLRKLPLHLRKTSLARLLARRLERVFINPFERGEIGPDLFRATCRMGLDDIVSKHGERMYQAVRSRHWIKVKNRKHRQWIASYS